MIPARRGIAAYFGLRDKDGNPRKHYRRMSVQAWDDRDGMPLVVEDEDPGSDKSRWLHRADNYDNYTGLGPDYPEVVSLIPAGGWRIEYQNDDGPNSSEPLVGWGLTIEGSIRPLTTDSLGWVETLENTGDKFRIYHPELSGGPE